jgi:hypothetical protein
MKTTIGKMEFVSTVEEKERWLEAWTRDLNRLPREYEERRRRRLLARKNELERELWAINAELNIDKYPLEEV